MSVPDQILPSTDPSLNSGTNWSRSGDTYTTTGQFASIIFDFAPLTTGKIYFEITRTSGGDFGWYFGIQRAPTRTGNFHDGTSTNGNGASVVTVLPTLNTRHRVIVDLDAATMQVDNGSAQTLSGTGPIYFGIYDGASGATGSGTLFYKTNTFNNSVPSGTIGWYDALLNPPVPAPTPGTLENPFQGTFVSSNDSVITASQLINLHVLTGITDVAYVGSTFIFDLFLEKSGRIQQWTDS